MGEVYWERKKVVELLHFEGHTPLFFEREPWIDDPSRAKRQMDDMLARSDAIVQIHYLTSGDNKKVLGDRTPIWYEFTEFAKNCRGPCLLLRKRSAIPDPGLRNLSERVERYPFSDVVEFEEYEDWGEQLLKWLHKMKLEKDLPERRASLVIRYSGKDYVGLLEAVSRVLFRRYSLNIDYMSYAAVGGVGTLCLTCSTREEVREVEKYAAEVQDKLREELAREDKEAREEGRFIVGSVPDPGGTRISVERKAPRAADVECYLEVRHADLPGQVFAICGVIKDLGVNIDEIGLYPTEHGFSKQRIARIWLSRPTLAVESRPSVMKDHESHREREYQEFIVQVEDRLSRLIGVRSASGQRQSRGL